MITLLRPCQVLKPIMFNVQFLYDLTFICHTHQESVDEHRRRRRVL